MRLLYKITYFSFLVLLIWSCEREKISDPVDDSISPATPSELQVFAAFDGQIGIEWNHNQESNLNGYFIYKSMNNQNQFVKTDFTSNNYFIDVALHYDSTYYYKVSAISSAGLESNVSSAVSATPKNFYAPLSPKRLSVSARNWDNSTGLKIFWDPASDKDVAGYEIYRGTASGFQTDKDHYLDFTSDINYWDTRNIQLLTDYYYKIIAVDKGGLKSPPSSEVNDMILNSPQLTYPGDNSILQTITEFRFKAVSVPAKYKLVIQSNPVFGTLKEFNFSSEKRDEDIRVAVSGLPLDPYRTYTWRLFTYTKSEIDPNSYSSNFTFTYSPKN